MELIPHIDIIEPERFRALQEDPHNFTWRAVDSETLDSWTPDLGLTGYPQPSIYRAGAVARSGISSTLRQRFWQTVESQADHTGSRYIGILIYLEAGENSPLELRLASHDIGRIEPQRLDNRLHLLVVDKPVEFIGAMEIFQLTAPGPGNYRIEQFLLLHERPQPSSFVPEIRNLTLRSIPDAAGKWEARLHFVTTLVARTELRVKAAAGPDEFSQAGDASRLHRFCFKGLTANREFEAQIVAIDSSGENAEERLRFFTMKPATTAAQTVVVPLELMNPQRGDFSGLPLTFGLPFAPGAVSRIDSCELRVGGEALTASAQPVSRWEDSSIRWALVESRAPAALSLAGKVSATFHINPTSVVTSHIEQPRSNSVRLTQVDGEPILEVRGGPRLSLSDLRLDAILANGTALRAGGVCRLLRSGLNKLEFEVNHEDAQGVAHLRSRISLRAYPGQSFVTLHHRLEVISPAMAPSAAGGDLPPECADEMRANLVGDSGEESTLLKLRSFSLRIPFEGARVLRHGGENWQSTGGKWQLRHDHDLAHEVGGELREGRAQGHIRVDGDSGTLGVGCAALLADLSQSALSRLKGRVD